MLSLLEHTREWLTDHSERQDRRCGHSRSHQRPYNGRIFITTAHRGRSFLFLFVFWGLYKVDTEWTLVMIKSDKNFMLIFTFSL